jgi:hypothetical protein
VPGRFCAVMVTVGILKRRVSSSVGAAAAPADVAEPGTMTDPRLESQSDAQIDPPPCPECGETLTFVETVVSSGAFRTQAVNMPQIPIHYFDCAGCGTCWKLGTRLLPDPVRQITRDAR